MVKYLVILLDDTSVSYCHYENERLAPKLISIDDLKAGVLFAMKENLRIQFIYPDYDLPIEYKDIIHTIDHTRIVSTYSQEEGDIIVINGFAEVEQTSFCSSKTYVLRLEKSDYFSNINNLKNILDKILRLNIVITDEVTFNEEDYVLYKESLNILSSKIEELYVAGQMTQLNILTDRMCLSTMNNCNAGWESITLAPDGNFYVCPAFYQTNSSIPIHKGTFSIGNINTGLEIKNPQLYKLSHAPLCRKCDAYQCKRCIWMNRKQTFEVNIPGREQCVVAHIERNASRELLQRIRKHGEFMPNINIKEINYLDPFDIIDIT